MLFAIVIGYVFGSLFIASFDFVSHGFWLFIVVSVGVVLPLVGHRLVVFIDEILAGERVFLDGGELKFSFHAGLSFLAKNIAVAAYVTVEWILLFDQGYCFFYFVLELR